MGARLPLKTRGLQCNPSRAYVDYYKGAESLWRNVIRLHLYFVVSLSLARRKFDMNIDWLI